VSASMVERARRAESSPATLEAPPSPQKSKSSPAISARESASRSSLPVFVCIHPASLSVRIHPLQARGPRPARLASACVSWQSSTSLRPRLYAFLRSALAAGRVPHAHMHTPTNAHTEMRTLSLSLPSLSRAYENAYACARGTAQTRPRGHVASLYLPRPSIIDTPYQHDLQSSRRGGFLSPGHVVSTSFYLHVPLV
jgi:hypothetical protein